MKDVFKQKSNPKKDRHGIQKKKIQTPLQENNEEMLDDCSFEEDLGGK